MDCFSSKNVVVGEMLLGIFSGVAVVVLAISQNILPLVALVLSFTFGIYGVLKKQISLGPVLSVTTEVFTSANSFNVSSLLALFWNW